MCDGRGTVRAPTFRSGDIFAFFRGLQQALRRVRISWNRGWYRTVTDHEDTVPTVVLCCKGRILLTHVEHHHRIFLRSNFDAFSTLRFCCNYEQIYSLLSIRCISLGEIRGHVAHPWMWRLDVRVLLIKSLSVRLFRQGLPALASLALGCVDLYNIMAFFAIVDVPLLGRRLFGMDRIVYSEAFLSSMTSFFCLFLCEPFFQSFHSCQMDVLLHTDFRIKTLGVDSRPENMRINSVHVPVPS